MVADIDSAFVQAFQDVNTWLPIAYENDRYEPVAGQEYAELLMLQNDVTPWDVAGLVGESDGVFRVILRYPVGAGAVHIKRMADTIMAAFPFGRRVEYGDVSATVVSHSRQPGVAEAGWYKMVITIGYRAFIRR